MFLSSKLVMLDEEVVVPDAILVAAGLSYDTSVTRRSGLFLLTPGHCRMPRGGDPVSKGIWQSDWTPERAIIVDKVLVAWLVRYFCLTCALRSSFR